MHGVYYPWMAKRLMNLVLAAYLAAAGGLLLAVAAWRASRGRAGWSPGQLYLAFGVHAMSWTLSAVIGQSMLLAAIFAGEIWIHWFPLLVAANVATGVPALCRWRALVVASVGARPLLLALR